MKPLNILLLDDEECICTLVSLLLERNGHTVNTATSGKSALQFLATQHCDLIITDIIMPDVDGLEIIQTAKKLRPAVRILAISGGGDMLSRHDCLKMAKLLGASAVLSKPFNESQLQEAINQAYPADFSLAG